MTDEPCARPGCGAPMAWHGTKATLDELLAWRDENHQLPLLLVSGGDGVCQGNHCVCAGYLAPEPPQPERTAYVILLSESELLDACALTRDIYDPLSARTALHAALETATPLTNHLAPYPLPPVRECIISDCANTSDQGTFVGDLCAPCSEYLSQWDRWQLEDGPRRVCKACCGDGRCRGSGCDGRCHVCHGTGHREARP